MLNTLTVPYYFSLLSGVNILIWEIFSLLLRLFNLQRHEYTGIQDGVLINNISNGFSTSIYNKHATGIVFGKWYIGYVSHAVPNTNNTIYVNITILCNSRCWERLKTNNTKSDTIIVYKHGSWINVKYRKLTPWNSQKIIIDKIIDEYKKENRVSVYICGSPGQGKSQIGMFVAQHFNSSLTAELNIFTDKEQRFGLDGTMISLINSLCPKEDKPLIIVVNEIDKILVHNVKNKPNGKQQWNEFLDEYNNGFYTNTILIFTSNASKSEIDSVDPSLLRAGRIHQLFEMAKDNVLEVK